MKKSIIFFVIIFLVNSAYSQEDCVKFDKAWGISSGNNFVYSELCIVENNYFIVLGRYNGNTATVGNNNLPAPPSPWEGSFCAKFDTLGNAVWATHAIGQGAGNIQFLDLKIDNLGNIYIVGRFNGTVNFQGNILTSNNIAASGLFDGFVAKLDTLGQMLWIETHPGTEHYHIVADQNKNNFYIASTIYGSIPAIIGQDTFNAISSGTGVLLTKINTQGQIQFVQQADCKGVMQMFSLSIDNSNNVFLSGIYNDTTYFGTHTLTSAYISNRSDMFIAKMSPQGTFEWATQTTRLNNSSKILTAFHSPTPQGNIFVYGRYEGNMDFGGNTISANNLYANYITTLNAQGQILYVEEILAADSARHLYAGNTDQNGSLYLSGFFEGSCTFGNTILNPVYENISSFVCKLNSEEGNTTFEWVIQPLGEGEVTAYKSICTDINEVHISGLYNDGDAVFGEHTLPAPPTGYHHGYIAKISECESSNINTPNPLAQISIYPNPANTQISISNLPANSTVNISDISGRVTYTQQTKNNTLQIPTTEWSSGMYLVSVSSNGVVEHRKVAVW